VALALNSLCHNLVKMPRQSSLGVRQLTLLVHSVAVTANRQLSVAYSVDGVCDSVPRSCSTSGREYLTHNVGLAFCKTETTSITYE